MVDLTHDAFPRVTSNLVIGDTTRQAMRYALKRKLGAPLRVLATLLGKAKSCVHLSMSEEHTRDPEPLGSLV